MLDAVQLNRKHSLIPDRETMEAQQQQHMLLVKERHTTQNEGIFKMHVADKL